MASAGKCLVMRETSRSRVKDNAKLKAMLHDAISLSTCNAILPLRDVKLANTTLYLFMFSFMLHFEQYSIFNISQKLNCIASCKKNCIV